MTVLQFPSAPSASSVRSTIEALANRYPGWTFALDVAEDGSPSVVAEHHLAGAPWSAHWDRRGWAVVSPDLAVVAQSTSLAEALAYALA